MKDSTKTIILFSAILIGLVLPFIIFTIAPHVDNSLIRNLLLAIGIPASFSMIFGSVGYIASTATDEDLAAELERIAKS